MGANATYCHQHSLSNPLDIAGDNEQTILSPTDVADDVLAARDVLNELQSETIIIDDINVTGMKDLAEKFGLTVHSKKVHPVCSSIHPFNTLPAFCSAVPKDGNCLFSSLAQIVCGTDALSGSTLQHQKMREIICNTLLEMPLAPEHFQMHSDFKCSTAESYLKLEKMRQDGVWGGYLEIVAFCCAFNVQAAVYNREIKRWILFKPINQDSSLNGTVVLRLNCHHFEPVISLCEIDGNDLNEDALLDTPLSFKSPKRRKTIFLKNSKISKVLPFNNIGADDVRSAKVHVCDLCKRNSTLQYPLCFEKTNTSKIKKVKFGFTEKLTKGVCLCRHCHLYCCEPKYQNKWSVAWPVVTFSAFVNRFNFNMLPASLQKSWEIYANSFDLSETESSLFLDITEDIKTFNELISCYTSQKFIQAVNTYCEPYVRCFCGASEFVYKSGKVCFSNLINFIDPAFKSFGANWRKKIHFIRTDYLMVVDALLSFKLRPCIVIDDNGLQLATCGAHNGGSRFRMIHVPRHPLSSNLSHPADNRLAVLAPSLRCGTPMKLGKFSNTFTISKASGGFNGVGCLTLSDYRFLNVKSNFLLPSKEMLFLRKRRDMFEVISKLADTYHLDCSFVDSLYLRQEQIPRDYEDVLSSSNFVSMATTLAVKEKLDTATGKWSKVYPTLQGVNNESIRSPIQMTHSLRRKNYAWGLLQICFANIDLLNRLLYVNPDNAAKERIRNIVNMCFQRNGLSKDLNEYINGEQNLTKLFRHVFLDFPDYVQLLPHNSTKLDFAIVTNIVIWTGCGRVHLSEISKVLTEKGFFCCFQECAEVDTGIWLRESLCGKPFLMNRKNPNCDETEIEFLAKPRIAIFVQPLEAPVSAVRFISGQNHYSCPIHATPLCIDFVKSGYFCVKKPVCKNKSNWRCPEEYCPFALCKKHMPTEKDSPVEYDLKRNANRVETNNSVTEEELSITSDDENQDLYDFLPPIPCADASENLADTDAAYLSMPVKVESHKDDLKSIPVQALFNCFLAVLIRPKHPASSALKFKRLLQCMAAKYPSCSVSLLYLEALLFPAIFYHQNKDGSFPGAIPYFLYTTKKQCQEFGFEELMNHFKTRLSDLSLLTSSSVQYIQYVVDCMINLALGKQHSLVFFRKGLQSLRLGSERQKLFSRDLNAHSVDCEKRVRELAAAVAREPPTLFLTLTCNQREHPGIAPLLNQIEEKFRDASEEERRAALEGAMCTLVRAWSNTVEMLIDLLVKSKELILGQITKIWGRAEFQSTVGNLPHYHVLIWLNPESVDLDDHIQSAQKHIYWKMCTIFESSLGIIRDYNELQNLTDLCFQIQTHNCAKSGFRCLKRVDMEGRKICRTPPYPESHCHWKMNINVQYPEAALQIMKDIGMAKRVEGYDNWLLPDGKMSCEKWMYASSKGEHIIPTNVHLFCLTKSSTNVLALTGSFVSAYLTHYITKVEEHADARITVCEGGKSFRLRDEGIVNRGLSSVRHFMKEDKKRERKTEKVECSLLSVTEGVHWIYQLPDVITNLVFIHIPNVPPEDRFVKLNRNKKYGRIVEYRRNTSFESDIHNLTESQKVILEDVIDSGEAADKVTAFGLRPPELLIIDSIGLYYRCFVSEKCSITIDQYCASHFHEKPWIDCSGSLIKIRSNALEELDQFIRGKAEEPRKVNLNYIINICKERRPGFEKWMALCDDQFLPEIVFRSISPRYVLKFLISFVLRFGFFETELDLFSTNCLKSAYVKSGLIPDLEVYSCEHVMALVSLYAHEELRFLPGGALTFSAKLVASKNAFARLLNVEEATIIQNPTVLVSNMHAELEEESLSFFQSCQQDMFEQVCTLRLHNLPNSLLRDDNSLWNPEMMFAENQSEDSKNEQVIVLNRLCSNIKSKISTVNDNRLATNDLVLGPPGSGKSYICSVALAYALFNGMACYMTSLAARRSNQLGGEHAHKLFHIPCKEVSASMLAEEALVRLSNDVKRKNFLERIQFLVIEEVSVLNGEIWAAMDMILQKLKDNYDPFGGIYILANGDCCQLPSVSGTDIFTSSSLVFGVNFHFLEHLVRMEDENGKLLLKLMTQRPIPADDIFQIIGLFSENANFISCWEDITDRSIMKVFGKKAAEREAIERHFSDITADNVDHFFVQSVDEISLIGSNSWRPCQASAVKYLNSQCREPEKLMIYTKAIVRFTRNMKGLSQGSLAVIDYVNSSAERVAVFCARTPEEVTEEAIESEIYRTWPTRILSPSFGFTLSFKGNSVRRKQFPICNYVASNCHRLMGDGFPKMATAISEKEGKYSLWLPSQVFVIGSRVRHLEALSFVGEKEETLRAMQSVLSKRNLKEERIYRFFEAVRSASVASTPAEIPMSPFLQSNFSVPKTANGFVFGLVSLKDNTFRKMHIGETEEGLSDAIRKINSTDDSNLQGNLYSSQPWAIGFFIWSFLNTGQRRSMKAEVEELHINNKYASFNDFCHLLRISLNQKPGAFKYTFCGHVE